MVLPYLKGLVIIKCGFFYLACGSIVYSVFVVIISSDLVFVDPQSNIEETTLFITKTLEVGKHHTMDPIMEGILSCSLASSRGETY